MGEWIYSVHTAKRVLRRTRRTNECLVALRVSRRDYEFRYDLQVPPLTQRATTVLFPRCRECWPRAYGHSAEWSDGRPVESIRTNQRKSAPELPARFGGAAYCACNSVAQLFASPPSDFGVSAAGA